MKISDLMYCLGNNFLLFVLFAWIIFAGWILAIFSPTGFVFISFHSSYYFFLFFSLTWQAENVSPLIILQYVYIFYVKAGHCSVAFKCKFGMNANDKTCEFPYSVKCSCLFGCCHCLFAQINHSGANFHLQSTAFSLFHGIFRSFQDPYQLFGSFHFSTRNFMCLTERKQPTFIRIACIKCVCICAYAWFWWHQFVSHVVESQKLESIVKCLI